MYFDANRVIRETLRAGGFGVPGEYYYDCPTRNSLAGCACGASNGCSTAAMRGAASLAVISRIIESNRDEPRN